jgi:NDP-sugar pyrophosphorylase family protein
LNQKEKIMIEVLTAHRLWHSLEQHTLAASLLVSRDYPWQILGHLCDFIRALGAQLPADEYEQVSEAVWVARTAHLATTVHIDGPTIIGHDTELRPGAYIRGGVLVGDGAVIGNSTELKNCILFDGVQVPHFNYVGDSVLGYRAHLGAGAITSNVKSDHTDVTIRSPFFSIDTGRRKLGAILGDRVEIGCNTVLNPGTVVGRESTVYPCQSVRGYIEQGCIWRGPGNVIGKK